MTEKKKKAGLFAKIVSREEALKTVKDSALAFLFVAVLQAAIGFFIAPSLIIDAVIFAILAGILWKWSSRVAAVLLLIMSGIVMVTTVITKLGIAAAGGSNIFLAIIILWVSIRAVEATFKLHGRYAE